MLTCDKFLFLHLHKSGGTFINQLMLACLPSARKIGYHLPASEIPSEFQHLPVLGTVRNPLGYYVSWYHFQFGLARRNALFDICSDGGTLGFQATIERLITLERRPDLVDRLIEAFPDHFVGSGLNLTKSCIASITDSGQGFYSFLYTRLYRAVPDATILKVEELRPALRTYLTAHYPTNQHWPTNQRWREFLDHAPDMNKSEHGAIGQYYPDELLRKVAEADKMIFDTHGYTTDA